MWLTTIIGYAVLAIELADVDAAALLMPIVEPYADVVAFNGATSQGPVAAYAGKLASLLDRHEAAEEHLMQALATATSFGWTYHRAPGRTAGTVATKDVDFGGGKSNG